MHRSERRPPRPSVPVTRVAPLLPLLGRPQGLVAPAARSRCLVAGRGPHHSPAPEPGDRGVSFAPLSGAPSPAGARHSEMTANLLTGNEPNFRDFSEWALIDHANKSDFDSAIPRFESWRPSQPQASLAGDFGHSRKWRHFRGLECRDPVSRQEFSRIRTESRESRGESLLDDFSISEIWKLGRPETGSNPHGIGGRVLKSLVKVLGRPIGFPN
jgi:hypothetical protein